MGRILVVYYSRSGTTRRIAREIADECGGQLEPIVDEVDRRGVFGYLRSALEAVLGLRAPIRSARHAPKAYELVVIGTPVWFWSVSSPVRSFIRAHRHEFRRVAFFCTCESSGQDKVLRDMRQLCSRPAVATLALHARDIAEASHRAQVARFANLLQENEPPAAPQPPHTARA